MKRNWDLVRTILTQLEEMDSSENALTPGAIEGYDPENVSYHMNLLNEARLIEATCTKPLSGPMTCFALKLTWDGHEFLDKIRTDTVWTKTKELIKSEGIDLSFDTIKFAATSVIKGIFE